MYLIALRALALCSILASVAARLPDGRPHANMRPAPTVPRVRIPVAPVTSRNGTTLPPYNQTYIFNQLIDHNNPELGTFQQRFWHTWEFYEDGGPIVLMTPGETNADGFQGYLTNVTINGQIAQQENGATIVIEHRFFGLSNPYPNLNDTSLKLLTLEQSVEDLVYFAQNVQLPMPGGDDVGPDNNPWILIGGSYPGALTAWTMVSNPGIFWAGYSSSGVVQAIVDYWGYFDPIRQFMPQNCSADVQAVIEHIDTTFSGTNQTAIEQIKNMFGMGNLTHLDDVAGALRNNLWDWQSLQPTSGSGAQFFKFCDALEVKNGESAPAAGWGLTHALSAWANYWKTTYLSSLCGSQDIVSCLGTYDPTQAFWTDTTIDNSGRSWTWFVCNEVGYFQEGAPQGTPSIVTRLVQPGYDERQCTYWFPNAFPTPRDPSVDATNEAYGGWDLNVDRLFFANGQRDPWRDATVSSDFNTRTSTESQPIAVGDAFHCSDLITSSSIDKTVLAVQQAALKSMKSWMEDWPGFNPNIIFGDLKKRKVESTKDAAAPVPIQKVHGAPGKAIGVWFRESEVY